MSDADRFTKLGKIFEHARLLPVSECDEYLSEACINDPELRKQVELLLEEHQRKSPLDSSTPGELASLVSQDSINNLEEPGSKIGRYTIVKHIGDGGMGSVYEAQQENPNRAVAIKVIKRGMDSKQVIARFEAERQSVAMMDHPSIARVFDAGTTDDGRPYFAMELVHGVSIIEYCDTNTLQTEQRLTLFTQVCRAIQHAHQKGVIHRDIKPSNVLVTEVDGVAIPKVIDFGIAKATSTDLESNTAFTLQGQLVGTPAYMSPEQAEMSGSDVDTRSDIYALGVLLYELLTGTTPFTEQELHHMGFVEMMRVICNDEPPRPSTRLSSLGESAIQTAELRGVDSKSLVSSLSGDLDWIVMMCLEKDRVKRYSTAFELSEDIRRFLHNEPVIARPHNTRYMLSKFVKRNRGRVVAGCVVASVLVLGVIGTTTGMIWALDERSNAEQSADKAISEALTGEAIIEYLLTDLLGAADPARLEDRDLTVREAVFIASESIEGKFADRPKVEARIRSTIARTLEQLGVFDEAEPHHRRQLELYESLEGQSGVLSIHARHALASNLMHQSRFDDAIKITLEEINILRTSREPGDEQLVNALSNLGVAYLQTGQYDDAAPILEESLVTKRVTQGDLDVSTLSSIHNLAGLYGQIGQHERSLELAKEAYEGRLEVLGPGDPRTFGSMNLVTWMLNALEEFDESKTILEGAIQEAKERLGPSHIQTISLTRSLSTQHIKQGEFAQAEAILTPLLATLKTTLGEDNINTFSTMRSLASSIAEQDRHEESLVLFEQALTHARSALPASSVDLAQFIDSYGRSLARLKKFDEAESSFQESIAILDAAGDGGNRIRNRIYQSIIDLYTDWNEINPDSGYDLLIDEWKSKQSSFH